MSTNLLVHAGSMLVFMSVLGLLTTLRRTQPLQANEIRRVLSVLMLAVMLSSFFVVLRDETVSRQDEDVFFTAVVTLVLILGMMLVRETRRQDLALRTSSGYYNAVMRHSDDAVLALDPSFKITNVNPIAQTLFGLSPETLAKSDLSSLLAAIPTEPPAFIAEWKRGLKFGQTQFAPETLVSSVHGKERWLVLSLLPVMDGEICGALVFLRDITYLKELEGRRADVEAREKMLVVLSHELRTPLSIIDGYAMLLRRNQKKQLPPDSKHIEGISNQAARMTQFVERVTRVHTEPPLQSRKARLELQGFLRDTAEHFAVSAPDHRISMLSSTEPVYVNADAEMLEHTVNNLLANAVKYTKPNTSIRLDIRHVGDEVRVAVHDEGDGIPPHELERLFDRFYRGSNSHLADGSGLGLHLAQQVVEDHGGRIWSESELGKGTTFYLTLPVLPLKAACAQGAIGLQA